MAYYLDRGIWFFGSHVESEVDKAGEQASRNIASRGNREALMNGARLRTLDKLLGDSEKLASKRFKDPVK